MTNSNPKLFVQEDQSIIERERFKSNSNSITSTQPSFKDDEVKFKKTNKLFLRHRSSSTASHLISSTSSNLIHQSIHPSNQSITTSSSTTVSPLASTSNSDSNSTISASTCNSNPSSTITTAATSSSSKPLNRIASKSFPKIKRVSSKALFGQFTQSFHSSSETSNLISLNHSNLHSNVPAVIVPTPLVVEGSPDQDHLLDYDPITHSDTRSFEEDGQEGSLQDALDVGDPNSFPVTSGPRPILQPPDSEIHHSSAASLTSSSKPRHFQQLSPAKSLQSGIQHGALAYPSPPSRSHARSSSNSPFHQTSAFIHRPTSPSRIINHSPSPIKQSSPSPSHNDLSHHPSDTVRRANLLPSQPKQSRDPGLTIIPAGPVPLPSRLSGWFQNAFSSSSSHLPVVGAPSPSLLPPYSPDKIKTAHPSKKTPYTGNSTPPDDPISRQVHLDSKRSPNGAPHFPSANMRGLGNFFDKAVNYMFDNDAHSYDSRLTADLWIMGGQQFSGVWKLDELHDENHSDDHLVSSAHTASVSGSDFVQPQPKKRSGLRRVTVGKTKAIFKQHANSSSIQTHPSPPNPVRTSVDFSNSSCKNSNPQPPLPLSPSPEPLLPLNNSARNDDPTLIPLSITHSYPPLFFHAFSSIIGLTYRTDFPPIPCSDRFKTSAIGAAGARVGGMLASLSMSIGRTGKKPTSRHGSSRSPSPRPHGGEEEDRTSDSIVPRGLTTDVGWGCMLRTGQSLLANALLIAHLGRDWRRPVPSITDPSHSGPADPLYSRLLSWFIDSSSPLAPFSVHRFVSKGKELGKEVGEWFGPSTAAGAIKALTNAFLPAGLGVATDVDGTVYRSDVYSASMSCDPMPATRHRTTSSSKTTWQRPVLVLINVRLGLEGVNSAYYAAIKATFTFPQSVGIAGGRPSSSYYFCGYQDDSLFYIDPHHSKPTIALEEPPALLIAAAQKISLSPLASLGKYEGDWEHISSADTDSLLSGSCNSEVLLKAKKKTNAKNSDKVSVLTGNSSSVSINLQKVQLDEFYANAYPDSALRTYHPQKVRRMNLSALDPSMLLGFLVKDEADWEDLTTRIRACKPPLFHIAEVTPSWMRSNPDPAHPRDSVDLRPSEDSDLGIDSWSEHEDWETQDHADDMLSSSSHSQRPNQEDDYDPAPFNGSSHDEELLPAHADSTGVDDEGWDDVKEPPAKPVTKSTHFSSIHPPAIIRVERMRNITPQKPPEAQRLPHLPFKGANPSPPVRAYSVNAMHSFPRGIDSIHSHRNPYRHSFSITAATSAAADDDDEQAEIIDCQHSTVTSDHRTNPPHMRNILTNVFPTSHQLVGSSSISPIRSPQREEPRTRNVSAATVRAARHSEEEHFLADSEEIFNHSQRRRLDSQGSSRALRT